MAVLLSFFIWLYVYIALIVRTLEWLGFVQEKEYRLDRILSGLSNSYAKKRLLALFPRRRNLTRTELKRPKFTKRIWATTAVLICVDYVVGNMVLWGLWKLHFAVDAGLLTLRFPLLAVLAVLILQPFLIFCIVVAITAAKQLYTDILLARVRTKVQSHDSVVVGVTGSFGKTATKLLIAHILSSDKTKTVCVTPKSINTLLGVAQYLLQNYQGQDYIVLEYAAYKKGEIARLARAVQPHIAVVTGVTHQHVSLFGSVDEIVTAKSELVQALPAAGVVFYPDSKPRVAEIVSYAPETARKHAVPEKEYAVGTVVDGLLKLPFAKKSIQTNLVGKQYALNVVLAAVVGKHLGVRTSQLIAALESYAPSDSYMKLIRHKNVTVIDNAGTSNPVGFKAAMDLARDLKKRNTYATLITGGIPDLGEHASHVHAELGAYAQPIFDQVLYTNAIAGDDFETGYEHTVISDRDAVVQQVEQCVAARNKQLVLVEGRIPGWLAGALRPLLTESSSS